MPAVTAIYRSAVLGGTASFEIEPPDEAEMLRRFRAIGAGGFAYLVAEVGGHVVGYAYAQAYRPRPAYRFTVENSIYIAPAMHGRGVGGALLCALICRCREAGFRRMIAVIGDSAQHASINLHRRSGFTHAGTLHAVGHKFGRWLDVVLMELPLGEGDGSPPRDPALPQGNI